MAEYRLYDNVIEKNSASSFVSSAIELLKLLNIEAPILKNTKVDIATEGKSLSEEAFLYNSAFTLASASTENADIICVEDSSYTSLNIAKLILLENKSTCELINQKLEKSGLSLNLDINILHINDILKDVIGFERLKTLVKRSFKDFNIAIFNGNKTHNLTNNDEILKLTGAKIIDFDTQNDSDGYEIVKSAPAYAKKLAAKVMLDMFDNGADFVVTNDTRSFYMFDTLQNDLEKSVGRDIALSVFSTSQVILLALGYEDLAKMGLDTHKVVTALI